MRATYKLTPFALATLLSACGAPATPPTGAATPGVQTANPGIVAAGGSTGSVVPVGSGLGAAGGGALGRTPMAVTPGSTPSPLNVPCDVAALVSTNCTTCHTATPKFGAPMPLMTAADVQAPAKTDPTRKVYQVIPERINATDITRRMPPASGTTIPAAGLKTLNDWLTAGALAAPAGCAIHEVATTPTATTGAGGAPAVGTAPVTDPTAAAAGTTMGGATATAQQYNDPDMKCYEFRAHAMGDKTMPFSVGTTPDMYTNFQFMPPWTGMMYARSFHVLPGNATVIHHWLMYKDMEAVTDGDIGGSTGAHPDGELIHGWAPGGSDLYFDSDVGFEMPSDVGYTLETHHNNTTGAPAPDNSGLQICVTPHAPTNVASLSWLGTDSINGASASGTCTPTNTGPIHVIGISPHMHLKGRHQSVILTRAGGMTETMHDAPFDFQYQRSYLAAFTIMPGDSIKTTCDYSAPTSFGEGTNDEMCYAFTLYYPKLALTNGNPVATLIHGPNTCLQ
jgi:Copper type II ascorbate-dependent monooxygenase, C-terminal domain